jgi:hypothetical protein
VKITFQDGKATARQKVVELSRGSNFVRSDSMGRIL